MNNSRHFILSHDTARRMAAACCMLPEYTGYHVNIVEPTRNGEQNKKLHACLSDIADQVEWMGKKLSVEIWKRLCTAAWLREVGEQPMLIPALDGNGFDVIFEHTSKLGVRKMAELIEWVLAFGSEQNVIWSEPISEQMREFDR